MVVMQGISNPEYSFAFKRLRPASVCHLLTVVCLLCNVVATSHAIKRGRVARAEKLFVKIVNYSGCADYYYYFFAPESSHLILFKVIPSKRIKKVIKNMTLSVEYWWLGHNIRYTCQMSYDIPKLMLQGCEIKRVIFIFIFWWSLHVLPVLAEHPRNVHVRFFEDTKVTTRLWVFVCPHVPGDGLATSPRVHPTSCPDT